MEQRQRLVYLSSKLAVEAAKYKRDYDAAYAQRKIGVFKRKNELTDEGVGVSKAEAQAEDENWHLRQHEKEMEGLYTGTRIIVTQTREALAALQQDLSILKGDLRETK
jgi:hypothetical protein